jgi:NAD(P)-dependent dehydrogenase (short-subunit alcohol dehydrogenase family)
VPTEPRYTLITGASSGIGRAIAVRLSGSRSLILHGRDLARLEETRRLCLGADHVLWTCDLAAVETISTGLATVLSERGLAVECFIHSAGMVTILPARSNTWQAAQKILTVNFISATQIVSVLAQKKAQREKLASVLFISSISSRFGARHHSLYSASKGALDAFMRCLAVELAPATRVNSLLLGMVQTKMAEMALADPEIRANLQRDYPLGLGTPADAAEAAAFLVSEKARWITGQEIIVDGGRTVNISLK